MGEWRESILVNILDTIESGQRPVGGATTVSGEIPSLGGENISSNGRLVLDNIKKIPIDYFKKMNKGKLVGYEVLINKDGANTGKVGYYNKDYENASINEHLFLLRGKADRVKQKYLYYSLLNDHGQIQIKNRITGSAQPGLSKEFVNYVKIYIPDNLYEQEKIAEILTSIDNTIEQTEKIIAKYKRMKQGLLQDLLTKGIDENGNIRSEATHEFKDSPLGRIPVEWEVSTLSNAGKIISGTTPDTDNPNYWNGEIVWITPYDLSKTPRMFIKTSERKISKKGLSACFSSIIPPYSIVISSRAPIGYFAIPTVEYVINQGCKSIILNEKIDNKFLYYQLNIIVKSMKRFGSGTTFTEISKRDLGKIKFVFPQKLEEQKNIAEILLSIDLLIEKEETYLKKLISIKQGLMQDLLTGKVRVTHLLDKGGELSGCHS